MLARLWNDDKALAEWTASRVPAKPCDGLFMPSHEWYAPFTGENREREAIAAARQGNFKLLAWLLDPPNAYRRPARLSAKAEKLIADRLRGTFKAKRTGPPKQTAAQRHANNAAYDDAAERALKIQKLYEQEVPEQSGHRARAITIAAHLAVIDREKLANHRTFKRRRPIS